MLKQLIKLANHFDVIGLKKEADYIDALLKKYSGDLIKFPGLESEGEETLESERRRLLQYLEKMKKNKHLQEMEEEFPGFSESTDPLDEAEVVDFSKRKQLEDMQRMFNEEHFVVVFDDEETWSASAVIYGMTKKNFDDLVEGKVDIKDVDKTRWIPFLENGKSSQPGK